mmetsp:Transcript_69214/g.130468  ORF Transcript_69214/g.130468 Transcript_69214/m.130468 type:complete len:225 (-) Transcript_69214:402-1076(-)
MPPTLPGPPPAPLAAALATLHPGSLVPPGSSRSLTARSPEADMMTALPDRSLKPRKDPSWLRASVDWLPPPVPAFFSNIARKTFSWDFILEAFVDSMYGLFPTWRLEAALLFAELLRALFGGLLAEAAPFLTRGERGVAAVDGEAGVCPGPPELRLFLRAAGDWGTSRSFSELCRAEPWLFRAENCRANGSCSLPPAPRIPLAPLLDEEALSGACAGAAVASYS